MKNQLISVLIRTKNSEKTIEVCLNYLLSQTIQIKEIIIVDSGSTDNTLNIINKYNCTIIHYPKEEIFNYSKAINIGIEQATGQYILILSSHVYILHKKFLKYKLHFLQKNQSVCAVSTYHSIGTIINKEIHSLKDVIWLPTSLKNFNGAIMSNVCAIIEKKYWLEYQFNEKIPRAEDQDWILYHMRNNNLAHISIYNACIKYNNPYFNMKKEILDYITIGRYLFPPYFSITKIIKLLTIYPIKKIPEGNLSKIIYYYRLVYYIIRERLGLGIKITSSYNKKLSQ